MFPRSAAALGLVGFVGLCLLVYAAGASIAATGSVWFASLNRPPGVSANPAIAPHVGLAYALLGIAGWRVWRRHGPGRTLRLWGWQLLLNALWAPALFGLRSPAAGMLLLLPAAAAAVATVRYFTRIDPWAAWLMVPLLCWIGYAGYFATATWWLNPA